MAGMSVKKTVSGYGFGCPEGSPPNIRLTLLHNGVIRDEIKDKTIVRLSYASDHDEEVILHALLRDRIDEHNDSLR